MRSNLLVPLFKPSVGTEELNAIKEVLDSRWIGLGPKTAEFEQMFAKYVGSNYAVGTNSGTAALHLALKVTGLRKDDEVLLPSLTFVSSAHAVLYCNATPVFVDIDEDTLTISIEDLERKITDKTKIIMPVHYGGYSCDMDPIIKLASEYGLYVIEDAAHACGAEYKGRKIGSIGNLTCFSFHAVKNLTTGEGGMITTNIKPFADMLRKLRWLGISKGTWDRYLPTKDKESTTPRWYYEVTDLGYKYHMSDIQAAIGIIQLRKIDKLNEKRRRLAKLYTEHLSKLDWIDTPSEKSYAKSVYHLYVIRVNEKYRDKFIKYMEEKGITTGVHYLPIHLHPYYRKFPSKVPTTEKIWRKLVSLPMYPDMTDREFEQIISCIREFRPS